MGKTGDVIRTGTGEAILAENNNAASFFFLFSSVIPFQVPVSASLATVNKSMDSPLSTVFLPSEITLLY
jgi:hypothetical protein